MKRFGIHIVILGSALALQACVNGENNPVAKSKKAMDGVSEAVNMVREASKSQSVFEESMERMQELKLITPASNEEFKGWLPENIEGFKRKGFSVGNQAMANISSVTGSFIDEERNKRFEVNVIDGAGEAGGVFTMVYMGQFNRDFEDEHADGFSKSVSKDSKKAVVSQNNRLKTSELEYLEGHRYYVKIIGENMDIDELWAVAEGMKTNTLPGL